MKRSRLGAIALSSAALLGAALASPALATTDSEIPTFQQFQSSTFKDTDQQYIVNGDEPEASNGGMRIFYNRMVDPKDPHISPAPSASLLDRVRRFIQVDDVAGITTREPEPAPLSHGERERARGQRLSLPVRLEAPFGRVLRERRERQHQ